MRGPQERGKERPAETPAFSLAGAGLAPAQRAALRCAQVAGERGAASARARIDRTLREARCPAVLYDAAVASVRAHARVVLHFHPDRHGRDGRTVAESLLADGLYRNQFETGLSAGSLSAHPGGSRDVWERGLFDGAYHEPGVEAGQRPKYGALELVRWSDGPVPRFGSCYLVLAPHVSGRTTFTFSGSEQDGAAERLGTIDRLAAVLAPLLEEVAAGGWTPVAWPPFRAPTLGVASATVGGLLRALAEELPEERRDPASAPVGRVLDSCVEAQVHGPIDLRGDVELIVVDPSFEGTSTGATLGALASAYGVPLRRHRGFRIAAADVPDDFRGPAVPALARRIAPVGWIDAATLGAAVPGLLGGADTHGARAEMLQHVKQLWHVLVHYGAPFAGR